MDIFTSLVIPALVGIGIGILSGMLGIGGGTVLVPIFRLAFGMSPIMSTATSLFTIIPTSVSGAVSHVRHKTCVPSLGLAAGLGGACTSPIGVWLATISPAWMVMLAAALIIGYSAVNMLRKAWKMKPARPAAPAQAEPAGETPVEAAVEQAGDAAANDDVESDVPAGASEIAADTGKSFPKLSRKQLAIGAAIGLGAGLASGYVGVGGGFIMVPLMLSLVGISMKQASGTSLIAVMLLAIPGTIEQGLLAGQYRLYGGHRGGCGLHPRRGGRRPPRAPRARTHAALHLRRLPHRGRSRARAERGGGALTNGRALHAGCW